MKDVFEKELVREQVLTENLKIRKKYKLDVEVKEKYDALTTLVMFFFFACIGWIIEVCWMFLKQGIIVNRGTLIGPWLPIYGYSCIFILQLFTSDKCKNITRNPLFTFIAIMLLCTVAEYITSLFLEVVYGLRWWDYSNELFNINRKSMFRKFSIIWNWWMFMLICYCSCFKYNFTKDSKKSKNCSCNNFIYIIYF